MKIISYILITCMEKNPLDILDKNFTTDYLEPSGNKYIFYGSIVEKEKDIFDINIKKWDIVYPIQRKSLRMLYVSKKYLTIYDFDWVKMIMNGLHDEKLFGDLRLHPSDEGFEYYANNLLKEMR